MCAFRAMAFLPILFFTSQPAAAQALKFYLSKAAMDCIVANEDAYIAAKTYDFAIVFPAVCPQLPDDLRATVGNEYLQLPAEGDGTPEEPEAIILPISRFACLRSLAEQTSQNAETDLLLVDLETCSISR